MRNRVGSSLLVLAFGGLAFGCGGNDSTGPEESTLSQAEAMQVFGEILSAVFSVGAGAPAQHTPGPAATPTTLTVDASSPCSGGGAIAVTGQYAWDFDQNGNGSYTYDIVETPNACGVTAASGSYLVNGHPNIHMSGSYSTASYQPTGSFQMTFEGGMSWSTSSGGGTGSCSISLNYDLAWSTSHGSVTGSICGYTINQSY